MTGDGVRFFISPLTWDLNSFLGSELELEVASAYGFSPDQAEAITRDLKEAVSAQAKASLESSLIDDESFENAIPKAADRPLFTSPCSLPPALIPCGFITNDLESLYQNPESQKKKNNRQR